MGWFGKAGKAGGLRRQQEVPGSVPGPTSGGNVVAAAAFRYGRDPLAFSYGHRLGIMSSLTSPAVSGRFRRQDQGAPVNRTLADLGAQQAFRGLMGAAGRAKVGMQGGPSQPAGYPSTNATVLAGLAAMDQPGLLRIGGLS